MSTFGALVADKVSKHRWIIPVIGITVSTGVVAIWYYRRRQRQGQSDAKDSSRSAAKTKPVNKANALKEQGNELFKQGRYAEAVRVYSEAIDLVLSDKEKYSQGGDLSALYQNRAAAYEKLGEHRKVVEDCSKALECNKRYVKAILRRAKAYERLNNFEDSLVDYTAGVVLENFQNQQTLQAADNVLRSLGEQKAIAVQANRKKPVHLSSSFVDSYLTSFCEDPVIVDSLGNCVANGVANGVAEDAPAPTGYERAKYCLMHKLYDEVLDACTVEIDTDAAQHKPEALLLRATFYLVRGDGDKAMADFEALFALLLTIPPDVARKFQANALIKRGSLHMQQGRKDEAMADFTAAQDADPDNADVYLHRGQLLTLLDDMERAKADFERSVKLRPDFAVSNVQFCYANYRQAMKIQSYVELERSMQQFEETVKRFPTCAEGFALLGQAYAEQQNFSDAHEMFEKAMRLTPENPNVYVHMGLLDLQWKGEPDAAISMIEKAIQVDPHSEFAYETLGTIEVQRGNVRQAIQYFEKALDIARTEMELKHLFTLREAAAAQLKVADLFGIEPPSMVS